MKIFIVTFGSRGDVQPYVALGQGLKAAGHEVTICTADRFESFVVENGLNYGYMSSDILKLIETDAGKGAMEDMGGPIGAVKTMVSLTKMAKPINKQMVADSWHSAEAVQPDLIIYHPKALGGMSLAEAFNVPVIMAILQPMMVPTAEFSTVGLPNLPLGGWYNRLTYKLISMGYGQYSKEINEVRQTEMGLGPMAKSAGALKTTAGQPIPVIHGFSDAVVPRPHDWPSQAYITGYWFLDQATDWEPSAELTAFLEAGPPPVYVGFGSMSGRNPKRTAEIVIDALQQANVRGIIATGWGGLDISTLPDTIFKIDHAPHDWLFERVAGVVHHGGAGTTAAGLRAGRPTLICPFFGDQPDWAARVVDLGAGPKPIPQKKLTAEKLAAGIQALVNDEAIRQKAAAVGEKIRSEDGVASAVTLIESLAQSASAEPVAASAK